LAVGILPGRNILLEAVLGFGGEMVFFTTYSHNFYIPSYAETSLLIASEHPRLLLKGEGGFTLSLR
jgi:hypothetical protein